MTSEAFLPGFAALRKRHWSVTNLLENAIKYTPGDGSVAIYAVACDGEIQISFKPFTLEHFLVKVDPINLTT